MKRLYGINWFSFFKLMTGLLLPSFFYEEYFAQKLYPFLRLDKTFDWNLLAEVSLPDDATSFSIWLRFKILESLSWFGWQRKGIQ